VYDSEGGIAYTEDGTETTLKAADYIDSRLY